MNIEKLKGEFHKHYKPKIDAFLSPFTPLWKAIVIFCKTSLGIAILSIIIITLLCKMIGGYYHHKYMRKYYDSGYYYNKEIEPRRRYDNARDIPMISDDDIFSRTERYIENQRNIMEDHVNQFMKSQPTPLIKLNSDGTGVQQSISRISTINGDNQGYTLTVNNNTINGSLIGTLSDQIKEGLQNNNVSLDNNNFSAPYTPELFQKITKLLEGQ